MHVKKTIISCLIVLCSLLLVLSACNRGGNESGTGGGSNSNSGSGGGTTAHSSPNNPGSTTQSGHAVGPSTGPETVMITLGDNGIQSSEHNFHPQQNYRFEIKNTGQVQHDFIILPKNEDLKNGTSINVLNQRALKTSGTIIAGQSKTVNYAFPQAATHTQPQFISTASDNYQSSMTLNVSVD